LTPHQLAGTPVVTGAAVEPRLQGQPWTSERRIRERAARRRARNDDGGAMNEGTRALRRRQRFARGWHRGRRAGASRRATSARARARRGTADASV